MATILEKKMKERKIISISDKRQITIPRKFYEMLSFRDSAECFIENNSIVIRPLAQDNGEFSVEILQDLVNQGYSGNELVQKFSTYSKQIKHAISDLIQEADDMATGKKRGATTSEVFGDSNDV